MTTRPTFTVRFDAEWHEFQVHYRYRGRPTSCPAADYADAMGTAQQMAQRFNGEVVDKTPKRLRKTEE
ncbi:hypothetical protein [Nitrospirillum iridis]|uniref:Uncharacterized protein n=1 Tax=Nitrospirillum iridis TaxID=765888 RepID=A0A7X0AZQ0_9PROT|nr:hypothetical protein [Nitrospirillum iridis]MBB6253010.1 hypothetical protein [Nitrospirillum iridis]